MPLATRVPYSGKCFIALQEACVLTPYPDGKFKTGPRTGQTKYSRGYGDQADGTLTKGSPATTFEQAWIDLDTAIYSRTKIVNNWLNVPDSTDYELSALVSGYYQLGQKMKYVIDWINKGDKGEACAVWSIYNRDSNGKFSRGIETRRHMEIRLFLKGDYQLTVPEIVRPVKMRFYKGDPFTTKYEEVAFPLETV